MTDFGSVQRRIQPKSIGGDFFFKHCFCFLTLFGNTSVWATIMIFINFHRRGGNYIILKFLFINCLVKIHLGPSSVHRRPFLISFYEYYFCLRCYYYCFTVYHFCTFLLRRGEHLHFMNDFTRFCYFNFISIS